MRHHTTWPGDTHAADDRIAEQRHELRAALFGIEALAQGLSLRFAELTSVQISQLTTARMDGVRRVRALLDDRVGDVLVFDLAVAIGAGLTAARSSGQFVASVIPHELRGSG